MKIDYFLHVIAISFFCPKWDLCFLIVDIFCSISIYVNAVLQNIVEIILSWKKLLDIYLQSCNIFVDTSLKFGNKLHAVIFEIFIFIPDGIHTNHACPIFSPSVILFVCLWISQRPLISFFGNVPWS